MKMCMYIMSYTFYFILPLYIFYGSFFKPLFSYFLQVGRKPPKKQTNKSIRKELFKDVFSNHHRPFIIVMLKWWYWWSCIHRFFNSKTLIHSLLRYCYGSKFYKSQCVRSGWTRMQFWVWCPTCGFKLIARWYPQCCSCYRWTPCLA